MYAKVAGIYVKAVEEGVDRKTLWCVYIPPVSIADLLRMKGCCIDMARCLSCYGYRGNYPDLDVHFTFVREKVLKSAYGVELYPCWVYSSTLATENRTGMTIEEMAKDFDAFLCERLGEMEKGFCETKEYNYDDE